jgi:MoxR-like ATPase
MSTVTSVLPSARGANVNVARQVVGVAHHVLQRAHLRVDLHPHQRAAAVRVALAHLTLEHRPLPVREGLEVDQRGDDRVGRDGEVLGQAGALGHQYFLPDGAGQDGAVFDSPAAVATSLAGVTYLADPATATTVYLAAVLEKPLLVEGPAGVGKTQLAKAVAAATGAELIRLQCYEGLDEARALYEWNYKKQLLRIQAASGDQAWEQTHDDIFTDEFLLTRPLLTAIRRDEPTVLLIDEADKTDVEVEALLLEVLSEFQVTIPELGTVRAVRKPFVVVTSNATRELSEALKRRCLYLHLDYPTPEREREIVLAQVPGLTDALAEQLVRTAATLRTLELKKSPSVAETVDWARTVLALGVDDLDETAIGATLGVVLKHHSDHARARKELGLP